MRLGRVRKTQSSIGAGLTLARLRAAVITLALALTACTKKPDETPLTPEATLTKHGRFIYMNSCIACHNSDPKLDGTLGPAVYGSSKELITARLLTASYPQGYTPKRKSKTMIALPHLKNEIDAIDAYLNAP